MTYCMYTIILYKYSIIYCLIGVCIGYTVLHVDVVFEY
jgi:hypothetical protein